MAHQQSSTSASGNGGSNHQDHHIEQLYQQNSNYIQSHHRSPAAIEQRQVPLCHSNAQHLDRMDVDPLTYKPFSVENPSHISSRGNLVPVSNNLQNSCWNKNSSTPASDDQALRAMEDEARRAKDRKDKEEVQEQVMKHFEDSFCYVQHKNAVHTGYSSQPTSGQAEDAVTSGMVVGGANGAVPPIDPKNFGNHQASKTSFTSYPVSNVPARVKVSSPAPQKIYGKPNIEGSNTSPACRSSQSDSIPLSLTSKGSTRSTTTNSPVLSSTPTKPEVSSMYSNVSSVLNQPPSVKPDQYQTQPLDLGGKRKTVAMNHNNGPVPRNELYSLGIQKALVHNVDIRVVPVDNQIRNLGKPDAGYKTASLSKTQNSASSEWLNMFKNEKYGNGTIQSALKLEEVEAVDQRTPGVEPESDSAEHDCGKIVSNGSPSSNIHKGKKVFLERHSGQDSTSELPSTKNKNGIRSTTRRRNSDLTDSDTSKTSVRNGSGNGESVGKSESDEEDTELKNGSNSARKRHQSSSDEDYRSPTKRQRARRNIKRKPKDSESENISESESNDNESQASGSSGKKRYTPKSVTPRSPKKVRNPRRAPGTPGNKTKSTNMSVKSNPFNRPPKMILKKTGQSFLQDAPCIELPLAPKLSKCRECRLMGAITKNLANCRFYAFRKLKYTKHGTLVTAGFSNPTLDPTEDDLNLWLPSKETPPESLDLELAKFLIDQLGDQFCELIHQEKEAKTLQKSLAQDEEDDDDDYIAWKRVVEGVREMCDVCDTTLFNFHWACKKCGFGVCIACYRARNQGKSRSSEKKGTKDHDEFQWLFCSSNKQAHDIESLMLTQAIAGEALTTLGKLLHNLRAVWRIPQECGCDDAKRLNAQNLESENVTTNPIGTKAPDTQSQLHEMEDSDEDVDGFMDLAALLTVKPGSEIKSQNSAVIKPQEPSIRAEPVLEHYVRRGGSSIRARKQTPAVQTFSLTTTQLKYPTVPHSWLTYGRLLRLHDPSQSDNQDLFREVWIRGQPVIVSNVAEKLNKKLWSPEAFLQDFSELKNDLVNCTTGRILANQPMKKFWEGFEHVEKRLKDEKGNPMLLKLKDWPPGEDFAESLPSRFLDLMNCLPLKDYTQRNGRLNLASRLPLNFVRPDLGPKMYIAYGSGRHLEKGTTNLHLDTSDAVNLMVYVGVPKDVDYEEDKKVVLAAIEESDVDGATVDRVRDGELPGALWHIYNFKDADKIRDLLNKVAIERGTKLEAECDPIHDQNWYLDKSLRDRLVREYDTVGFPLVQFEGDAVFIPAGAPHQVRNLHNCIKIAEDFVSPENVSHCFKLTEEFRDLTDGHSNHEDKLQIKNIIYHAVKDAVSVLYQNMNETQRKIIKGMDVNGAEKAMDTTTTIKPTEQCV